MAVFFGVISGPKTRFEVAGARGAPGTGFVARHVGAGRPTSKKKYDFECSGLPSGQFSGKTNIRHFEKHNILTSGGGWRAWGPRRRVSRALRRGLGCQTQEKIRYPISNRSGRSIFTNHEFWRFASNPGISTSGGGWRARGPRRRVSRTLRTGWVC